MSSGAVTSCGAVTPADGEPRRRPNESFSPQEECDLFRMMSGFTEEEIDDVMTGKNKAAYKLAVQALCMASALRKRGMTLSDALAKRTRTVPGSNVRPPREVNDPNQSAFLWVQPSLGQSE